MNRWAGVMILALQAGCGLLPLPGASEDDAAIAAAAPLVWNGDSSRAEGQINSLTDVDTFDLGPLPVGTRITAVITGTDGLDPVAAVFDEQLRRWAFADDVDFPAGDLTAVIDEIVRFPSDRYVLAVAGFGIAPKPATTGRYQAVLTRSPAEPPPTAPHVVVIRYQGGSGVFVDDEILGRLGPWDVSPFDPAVTVPRFADQFETIKRDLAERIRDIYAGFRLIVLDDSAALPDEPFSSVYLVHGVDEVESRVPPGVMGIARADFFNRQKDESIFIFVERLAARSPTVEVFTNLAANLIAHEIGHALGLLHVRSADALMAPSLPLSACCTLNKLVAGPMVEFPLGSEDPVLLLTHTLGLE